MGGGPLPWLECQGCGGVFTLVRVSGLWWGVFTLVRVSGLCGVSLPWSEYQGCGGVSLPWLEYQGSHHIWITGRTGKIISVCDKSGI